VERTTFVADLLIAHRRQIVRAVIDRTGDRVRLDAAATESLPELVADLSVIFIAIARGIGGDGVKAIVSTEVRQAILRHAGIRRSQGLSPAALVDEYLDLGDSMVRFVEKQSRQVMLSGSDSVPITCILHELVNRVVRTVVQECMQWRAADASLRGSSPTASTVRSYERIGLSC